MGTLPDMSHEWRAISLPDNISCAGNCWIQSAHVFGLFRSRRSPGLEMAEGSGLYGQTQLIVGPQGKIELGEYACINSATLHCQSEIRIGAHCLVAWGAVIFDCLPEPMTGDHSIADGEARLGDDLPPAPGMARPVVLEDNVWLGFGSIVCPGVTIGQGTIIGTRTVITEDVPPYVVVAGSPARIIRKLEF